MEKEPQRDETRNRVIIVHSRTYSPLRKNVGRQKSHVNLPPPYERTFERKTEHVTWRSCRRVLWKNFVYRKTFARRMPLVERERERDTVKERRRWRRVFSLFFPSARDPSDKTTKDCRRSYVAR